MVILLGDKSVLWSVFTVSQPKEFLVPLLCKSRIIFVGLNNSNIVMKCKECFCQSIS